MSETKIEQAPTIVHYEGLDLEFHEDAAGKGFNVVLVSNDPVYEQDKGVIARAEFSDGCILGYDEARTRVDDDVYLLYIDTVNNDYAPVGTATKLMKFGLEEGRRRGFEMARAGIHNPRIVTIIEKLVAEGVVKNSHYFNHYSPYDSIEDSGSDPSTTDLLQNWKDSTAKEATAFLNSYKADKTGFVLDAVVYGILEL